MRKILATLFCLLAGPALAQTGSSKSTATLNTEVNTLWPDNTTGQITPFNARQTLLDIIASYPNLNTTASANTVYAGPASGSATAPTFRALVGLDMSTGTFANVLNTQTNTNYTLQTSDCRKSISMVTSGASSFTFTLPATAGFASDCSFGIFNSSAGRGVLLSGFPSGTVPVLWPLQSIQVSMVNGVWAVVQKPLRWRLTANTTFFVGSTGADTNDGLAAGAGNAWQTLQGAYDNLVKYIDLNLNVATISIATGTYTAGVNARGAPVGSGGPDFVVFQSTSGTASDVLVNVNSATLFPFMVNNGGVDQTVQFTVKNLTVQNATGSCITADGGVIYLTGVSFNACGNAARYARHGGKIAMVGNITYNSNVGSMAVAQTTGQIYQEAPQTLSLSANITCSNACVVADGGQVWTGGLTISLGGFTVTGQRFSVTGAGGYIVTNGAGPGTLLPGTIVGTVNNGGYIDEAGTMAISSNTCTGCAAPFGSGNCGSGAAIQSDSSDDSGSITLGTAAGGSSFCMVNLLQFYNARPHCRVTVEQPLPGVFTYSPIIDQTTNWAFGSLPASGVSRLSFGYSPTTAANNIIQWSCTRN